MNVDLAQELLNELGASLENLETRHAALFQFLEDKGILRVDQIAPYLEQAGKASNVRWRAAHIRLESLFRIERQKDEELREKRLRETGAGQVPTSQNQKQKVETENEAGGAKAAPRNQEARTDGAFDGAERPPVSNRDEAQDERAT